MLSETYEVRELFVAMSVENTIVESPEAVHEPDMKRAKTEEPPVNSDTTESIVSLAPTEEDEEGTETETPRPEQVEQPTVEEPEDTETSVTEQVVVTEVVTETIIVTVVEGLETIIEKVPTEESCQAQIEKEEDALPEEFQVDAPVRE